VESLFPYTLEDAQNFIESSHKDFTSLKSFNFAIEYKKNRDDRIGLVGIISIKDLSNWFSWDNQHKGFRYNKRGNLGTGSENDIGEKVQEPRLLR
jgi:hypothetical protein